LVNQKAVEIVNLSHEIKNGIVLEQDIPLFVKEIKYTKTQKKAALIYSEKQFFENGITTVSDAGVTLEEINLIKELHENYDLQMRIYGMLYSEESGMNFYAKNGKDSTDKLAVNSIKLVMDGSVGSGTACFKKPYRETANYGKLLVTKDSLRKVATYCYENDFQLNVHCIGDSAVKVVLDIMGEILQVQNDRRWRIEHAQAVDKIDIDKFLKYSIIPSVQPTHGIDDRKMALDKLHKYAFINSYKIETLLAQNGIITFGSDFPVADKNPIVTFYNAVVRETKEGEKFSTLTGEKTTRKEALNAITFWAAMANLQEQNRGSLEVGKYADFVILDRDIMKVSENDILKTQVKFTFLDGEKVFEQ
jgi:predicted amidohydrolase YtcJ